MITVLCFMHGAGTENGMKNDLVLHPTSAVTPYCPLSQEVLHVAQHPTCAHSTAATPLGPGASRRDAHGNMTSIHPLCLPQPQGTVGLTEGPSPAPQPFPRPAGAPVRNADHAPPGSGAVSVTSPPLMPPSSLPHSISTQPAAV